MNIYATESLAYHAPECGIALLDGSIGEALHREFGRQGETVTTGSRNAVDYISNRLKLALA